MTTLPLVSLMAGVLGPLEADCTRSQPSPKPRIPIASTHWHDFHPLPLAKYSECLNFSYLYSSPTAACRSSRSRHWYPCES